MCMWGLEAIPRSALPPLDLVPSVYLDSHTPHGRDTNSVGKAGVQQLLPIPFPPALPGPDTSPRGLIHVYVEKNHS